MAKQGSHWRKRDSAQNEFKEELIDLARVTRVVKWWRRMRFRATVVAWDGKWVLWLWVWKANEVTIAIKKAIMNAKKDLIKLPIVDWTIDRDVFVKYKWAQILLMPACEGTWIIAWWSIRKMAEVAWLHNLLSKRFWSTNKLVNAQAMMKAIRILESANKKPVKKVVNKDENKDTKENDEAETLEKKSWESTESLDIKTDKVEEVDNK